jgi:hypothetical protein
MILIYATFFIKLVGKTQNIFSTHSPNMNIHFYFDKTKRVRNYVSLRIVIVCAIRTRSANPFFCFQYHLYAIDRDRRISLWRTPAVHNAINIAVWV